MLDYTSLPDLLALALLVFVFWSILRRRVGGQLRVWLMGWIFVVLHFLVLLFAGKAGSVQTVAWVLSYLFLELAGAAFIYAAGRGQCADRTRWIASAGLLATSLYIVFGVTAPAWLPFLYAASVLLAASSVMMIFADPDEDPSERRIYAFLTLFLAACMAWAARAGYPDRGMDAIFCTLYLMAAIQCWKTFPGRTTGKFTAVIGLLAWAAVFPVGLLLEILSPNLHVQPSMWNIPKYIVAIGVLLTLLEEEITRTQHLALHDPLTGLPNRRLLEDRLTKAVERAERSEGRLAVLLIDLDNFKEINDTYGHAVGDEVLRVVATRLQMRVRKADTIARAGGDEFLVVVSDLLQPHGAEVLAGKLMSDLSEPVVLGEATLRASASIGVAIYPDDAQTAEGLCEKADAAMYEQKRAVRLV